MRTPSVSVVMPVHNAARYVHEAVSSVLSQDVPDLEMIVVDDASTDDSVGVIERIGDARIEIVRNAACGGPSRTRNTGIARARAPYVGFLDADDVMHPRFLSGAIAALQRHPRAGLAFSNLCRVDTEGRLLKSSVLSEYPVFQATPKQAAGDGWSLISREQLQGSLLHENFIVTTSRVILRKSSLAESGVFDEDLFNSEDRDLWFRLARVCDALYTAEDCVSYRTNPTSISHGSEIRNSSNRIRVLQRELQRWSDPAARAQIRSLIAENYGSLGYALRRQGDRSSAVRNFAAAFRSEPRWQWVQGMAASLLGRR